MGQHDSEKRCDQTGLFQAARQDSKCGFYSIKLDRAMFPIRLILMTGRKEFVGLMPKKDPNAMVFMKELLESGKIVPVIDRRHPLSEAASNPSPKPASLK